MISINQKDLFSPARDETSLTADFNLRKSKDATPFLQVPHGTALFRIGQVGVAPCGAFDRRRMSLLRRLRFAPPAVNKVKSPMWDRKG